ncbi:DUF2924 domain-containing protein [Altericroceibacterium xinjiangense]|uniref:DUF2924 domain-containing protein n=1 Tax=Altericroceibacterium xinjiangense TaxID=762261 RepID=UPI0019D03172|nr:DUF2924 domain-containing protein [Altericroceibacterium xinjiangense]
MKPTLDLDTELGALPTCSRAELRQRWTALTGKPAPKVSAALMRMALGAELQAHVYGGLSARTQQRLARAAGTSEAGATAPKQRLMREWKGVLHTVTIEADETIRWQGKTWRSLSEVARAITGTRWSGPAFFGLKQKKAA